jgi:Spy/CpxP family protein refolding chaperone
MRRLFIILMMAGFAFGLSAQDRPDNTVPPWHGRFAEKGPHRMPFLDLSEDQEAKLEQLRLEFQKESMPLRTELRTLDDKYRLMVIDEKTPASDIEKNLEKQGTLHTKLKMLRTEHVKNVRAQLTDEQRTTFDSHFLSEGKQGKKGPRGGRKIRHVDRKPR